MRPGEQLLFYRPIILCQFFEDHLIAGLAQKNLKIFERQMREANSSEQE